MAKLSSSFTSHWTISPASDVAHFMRLGNEAIRAQRNNEGREIKMVILENVDGFDGVDFDGVDPINALLDGEMSRMESEKMLDALVDG